MSANTTVNTDLNKYNISNIENKYRPDVISHLQYHSCAHYPCTLTSVLYLTRPCGTPAYGRKSGPNQELARRPVWISQKAGRIPHAMHATASIIICEHI